MRLFLWSGGFAAFLALFLEVSDKPWVSGKVVWNTWVVLMVLYFGMKAVWAVSNMMAKNQAGDVAEEPAQHAPVSLVPVVESGRPLPDLYWPKLKLDDLAGMQALKQELGLALAPFRAYAKRQGRVADRNGILLSGPPGNGKTAFAEAIAGELGLPLIKVKGSDVQSRWQNQTGEQIADLFYAAKQQPCVLFFDEFETLAANRTTMGEEYSSENRKAVTALLPSIDEARRQHVVLVAATNYVEQLDSAVVRDGRFDFRIEVPYPDYEARVGILTGMLRKHRVTTTDEVIRAVARLWERRSVAFIEATVKRLRDTRAKAKVGVADFKRAARDACRRASYIPSTGAKLSELVLPEPVREEANNLIYRLQHWEDIADRGGDTPSGVLLYGPPGTGKTHFVRSLARELGEWHVFEVNVTDVVRDPRRFRTSVEMAGEHRPAIVFIDEADELLRERSVSSSAGATNEILKCMDGMMGRVPEVVFVAATNNAEFMDAAALRGGRFAEKIYMGPLQQHELAELFQAEFAARPNTRFSSELTPLSLATHLQEATPAHALTVLRKAVTYTFGRDGTQRPVSMADVQRAIDSLEF